MHTACGRDPQCGLDATRTFTYWCYAGRYDGRPSTGDDPLALSPCFWDRASSGQPGSLTVDAWAARICARFQLPMEACRAELRDVVRSCTEDLTGAGP